MLLAACGTDRQPSVPIRHYSDAEIATLKASLLKRIDDNIHRSCPRPVLHGEVRPGPAAPDLRALVEPTGPLADCLKKAQDFASRMSTQQPPKPLDVRSPDVAALDRECGPTIEAGIAAAVSHEDACSPYQTGVATMPDRFLPMQRAVHQMGLRSQLRDNPAEALWLMADAIRSQQDMMRGHTNLLVGMIAVSGMEAGLRYAEALLAKIDPKIATEIAPAFDALLASEPSFGGLLAGERDYYAMHFALARLETKDWVPPGGAASVTKRPNGTPADRDHAAADLAGVEELHAIHDRICPDGANEKACWIGLDSHRIALEGIARLGAFPEYVLKRAVVTAHLAALRIALEVGREARCPTPEELASPRYTALRSPVALGDLLRVTVDGKVLRIAPPAWASGDTTTWNIKCP